MRRTWLEVTAVHVLLLLAVAVTIGPFLWVALNSFKFFKDIIDQSWLFQPTLVNYHRLFFDKGSDFAILTVNSVIIALSSTALAVAIGSLAAYSLARFRWAKWASALILGWILFVHMLPPIALATPFFLLSRVFGVYNSHLAVVMAHLVVNLPIVVWMMKSFFDELPLELEEAALVDGCTRLGSFIRIALPLTAPGIAAAAILACIFSWNEFLYALTLTSTTSSMTVPVGIVKFAQEYSVQYGEMSAAAAFATLPVLLFVAFAQKQLVKGLTLGALKG